MAIRKILQYGDKKLNKVCEPITKIDEEVLALVQDLKDTLYNCSGVGLAAPQIGILKRAILIDLRDGSDSIVLLNPKIIESSGSEEDYEGCLSYEDHEGLVVRPTRVIVEGMNVDGQKVQYEAVDFLARAFCHEIDHLDGILYMSKATEMYELVDEE
ncbi:peptide deformylase [Clostridium sp. Marseille-Q7071]